LITPRNIARELFFRLYTLNGHFGRQVSIPGNLRTVAIIPSYSKKRARNLDPLVRNLLKCTFLKKVIVSNNNPEIQVEDWVKVRSPRLQLINQPVRRGCGYSFILAGKEDADIFISIDDDFLVRPSQTARLVKYIIANPAVPHGLDGVDTNGEFHQYTEMDIDILYNIYGCTSALVKRYLEIVEKMIATKNVPNEAIEIFSPDVVISRLGEGKGRIHNLGFNLRCRTANTPGVALHMQKDFNNPRFQVDAALKELLAEE
jgi:hypothetical protein